MRKSATLTAKQVAAIDKEGWTSIGGVNGLYLRIKNGYRYYAYRYASPVTGKRTFVSVGDCAEMSLAQARVLAGKMAVQVAEGRDIAADRRDEREELKRKAQEQRGDRLFRVVAERWVQERAANGYYDRNRRGEQVARSYLERDIYPRLGDMRIDDIKVTDVFDCVRPLWTTTTDAKLKCLTLIRNVFSWASATGFCVRDNPADQRGPLGVLLKNLSPHVKQPRNHGALDPRKMPEFFAELMGWGTVASKAYAFAILTASRSKPVREARWSDIDLEAKTWTCPESAMKVKARGVFTVLLSDAAVALLRSLPRVRGLDLVFPSPNRLTVLSDAGIGQVVTDINRHREKEGKGAWLDDAQTETFGEPVKITLHGTARATFKTWTRLDGNLKRFDRDAVELCLAHKLDDGFGGAYDRALLTEERRRIMQAWGEYCVSAM